MLKKMHNPYTLLVGMQNGETSMEHSLEGLQKIKTRIELVAHW
jgi:hypothetical protein